MGSAGLGITRRDSMPSAIVRKRTQVADKVSGGGHVM